MNLLLWLLTQTDQNIFTCLICRSESNHRPLPQWQGRRTTCNSKDIFLTYQRWLMSLLERGIVKSCSCSCRNASPLHCTECSLSDCEETAGRAERAQKNKQPSLSVRPPSTLVLCNSFFSAPIFPAGLTQKQTICLSRASCRHTHTHTHQWWSSYVGSLWEQGDLIVLTLCLTLCFTYWEHAQSLLVIVQYVHLWTPTTVC